ncbi:MAG TPA: fumarate reductase subunit C [Vicinamibacteria bacterium]|jgi:fumarate reductase subunit C|nr:fumarate reductase subunit C [Vicinamibacteria bacterium]
MSSPARYTPYHPKWYRRRVSVWWWLETSSYTGFVLRELTSVFVAIFALVLLWELRALAQGPAAYAAFLARLRTPAFLILHAVAFLFVLFHSVTWFNLAPKAMAVRIRGKRVPDLVVAGLNYGAWLFLSVIVAFILLRG